MIGNGGEVIYTWLNVDPGKAVLWQCGGCASFGAAVQAFVVDMIWEGFDKWFKADW